MFHNNLDDSQFCQAIRDQLLLSRNEIDIDSPRYDNPLTLDKVRHDLQTLSTALSGRYGRQYPLSSPVQSTAHQAYQDLADLLEQGIAAVSVTLQKSVIARNDVAQIRRHIVLAKRHLDTFEVLHTGSGGENIDPETNNEEFDYDVEKQPWYCAGLSQFKHIDEQDARSYVSLIDLVIMTVNEHEFNAVMKRLSPFHDQEKVLAAGLQEETYFLGSYGVFNAAVIRTRMGAQQPGSAGMAAYRAQAIWRPRALVALGVAFGAFSHKQRIADVLVATDVIPYHPARVGTRRIERGRPLPSDATLLNRFVNNSYDWVFKCPDGKHCRVETGPILSGEELIDDPVRKGELLSTFPEAIGGEMEGSGIAAVAVYKRTPWILVKAICDWADGNKGNKHQPLAAAAAADLAYYVFSQNTALGDLRKPARRQRRIL